MAENKSGQPSARKTTKRVTANNIFAGSNSKSTTRKTVKRTGVAAVSAAATVGAVKAAKKMSGKSIAVILICFILALAIGACVCFFLGRNDKFDFIGSEELSLTLNETYADEGVEIKEFGLDISKKATVKTNLKQNENGEYYAEEAGTYYMIYSVKSLKFGLIYPTQKIRLITFVEPSEGEN